MTLLQQLPPAHVLRTMMEEHQTLLGFVARLKRALDQLDGAPSADPALLEQIVLLARGLVAAEPHHQREEDVLFPRLEELGIEGPPGMMRMEHDELRPAKRRLLALAEAARAGLSHQEKLDLVSHGHMTASFLETHIFKEDQILYPLALREIEDADWGRLKAACDDIGYCAFPA